jgi:hypothetical protein
MRIAIAFCRIVSHKSNYFPQHPVLKHPQTLFPAECIVCFGRFDTTEKL